MSLLHSSAYWQSRHPKLMLNRKELSEKTILDKIHAVGEMAVFSPAEDLQLTQDLL